MNQDHILLDISNTQLKNFVLVTLKPFLGEDHLSQNLTKQNNFHKSFCITQPNDKKKC